MTDTLVKVDNVSKKFCRSLKRSLWYGMQDLGSELIGRRHGGNGELRPNEFWAVQDVSFELKRGECLGLIGRNGAGKTTLLRMLNGLIKPDCGRIEMRGRIGALIALGAGFNPILTGRENIYVNASVLGFRKAEIDTKLEQIVEFAELADFIDSPVQTYSSGMTVRLGFSIAVHLDPDVLIIDEILAVGDASFRHRSYNAIQRIARTTAVIIVSHSVPQLTRICDHGLLLTRGSPATPRLALHTALDLYHASFSDSPMQVFGDPSIALTQLDLAISVAPHERVTVFQRGHPVSAGTPITIEYGSGLELVFYFSLPSTLEGFDLYIALLDAEGNIVAQCFSSANTPSFMNSEAGSTTISLTIPNLNINRGIYSLNVTMTDAEASNSPGTTLKTYRDIARILIIGDIPPGAAFVQYRGLWHQHGSSSLHQFPQPQQ